MTDAMPVIRHRDYLDVASARDVATFQQRLVDFAAKLEFPLVNAALVVEQPGTPAAIMPICNTPAEFAAETRNASSSRRDPVLQRLKTMSIPFVYDQAMYVQDRAGDLWEEQARHGYRTGISMALHMSGGRHFLLGIDRNDPLPDDPDAVVRMMADVQLLAVFAQETAVRLLLPLAPTDVEVPQLTSREQEVLRWARDGKSNQVIGQLLNISLSTVNYHLGSAMSKLGVASKFHAAAKADSLGLL
jgi:DNA-binding CsgD family transcriptional regulator